MAARLDIDRITASHLKRLAWLLDRVDANKRDVERYTCLQYRFQRTFVEANGNQTFARLHAIVTESFVSYHLTQAHLQCLHGFREVDHRQIYQALRSDEAIRACRLVERHVMTSLDAVEP